MAADSRRTRPRPSSPVSAALAALPEASMPDEVVARIEAALAALAVPSPLERPGLIDLTDQADLDAMVSAEYRGRRRRSSA